MKYYFESIDSEMCYNEAYFQSQMEVHKLDAVTVLKAERMTNTGFFFCKKFHSVGEVNRNCGKVCHKYIPNNGKSGICKQYGYCYENTGEKVTLKLKP